MVLAIMLVAEYDTRVVDFKILFLRRELKNEKEICMIVPEGFEEFYSNKNTWLCIMKTIYEKKQDYPLITTK